MKSIVMMLSVFGLLSMSGLFLKECIQTPLGTLCRVKTGLAAMAYGTLAVLMIWGLLNYSIE